jgi:NAD(P)-dependent dehydrogenase (short-subunit alcohol dehydrogenase family)
VETADAVIVITGAASGVGLAAARRLAHDGARVVIADADIAAGEAAVMSLRASGFPHAGDTLFVHADVTRANELTAVYGLTRERFGRLDALINCAAVLSGLPRFPELPAERWQRVLEINLSGVVLATQLAVPLLKERGGAVVNLSALVALEGAAHDPIYGASCAGVLQFTRSLAPLKAEQNVRVCAVCPGVVDSPMLRDAADPLLSSLVRVQPALAVEEVAEAIAFALADESNAGLALRLSEPGERVYR